MAEVYANASALCFLVPSTGANICEYVGAVRTVFADKAPATLRWSLLRAYSLCQIEQSIVISWRLIRIH